MRVLHVIPSLKRSHGGPTYAVAAMARGLTALGVHVTVATTAAEGDQESEEPVLRALVPSPIDLRVFRSWSAVRPAGFSPALAAWLWREVRGFDAVHVHSLFNWQSLGVPRICAARDVPFIVRPLGVLDPWSLRQKAWKKQPHFQWIERPTLRKAARIHVTSESERSSVEALGFGGKVACIPLGVDVPEVAPRVASHEAGLRLLFLARLHPKKNLPALLEALTADGFRRPPTLTVAGTGDPAYVASLERLRDRLGLRERVRFVGFADGAQKLQLYAMADVFVLPSFQENFGVAVAEAMAHGLPVVLSPDVALARDVSEAGAGRVADVSTRGELARAIAVFEDESERKRASERAFALAKARFSVEHMATSLLSMYREITQ